MLNDIYIALSGDPLALSCPGKGHGVALLLGWRNAVDLALSLDLTLDSLCPQCYAFIYLEV